MRHTSPRANAPCMCTPCHEMRQLAQRVRGLSAKHQAQRAAVARLWDELEPLAWDEMMDRLRDEPGLDPLESYARSHLRELAAEVLAER